MAYRKFTGIERDTMTLNLPVEEMEALKRLHHATGISRTELLRQAIGLLFARHGVPLEVKALTSREKLPTMPNGRRHRHASEYLRMSLAELTAKD